VEIETSFAEVHTKEPLNFQTVEPLDNY